MDHVYARRIVHLFEWLLYIGGLCFILLGVLFMFVKQMLPVLLPGLPVLAKISDTFGGVAGGMLVAYGIASLWLGYGFHHYLNRARTAFLLLSVLIFLGAILGSYTTKTQFWGIGVLSIIQVWLFGFQREIVGLFVTRAVPKPTLDKHKQHA